MLLQRVGAKATVSRVSTGPRPGPGPEPGPGPGTDAYTGQPPGPGEARLKHRRRSPDPGPAQAQTPAQTQAQTQARPSQRAPIAAGGLKWQSYIRSLLGNVTVLKGGQNWIFKVWIPAAGLETPRGSQSRLQFYAWYTLGNASSREFCRWDTSMSKTYEEVQHPGASRTLQKRPDSRQRPK